MALFFVVIGLTLLLVGGDLLVRGASYLANQFGMSPLMIGLTVVAFGTSAPEMAICIDAALSGSPEIALGNIVGSNITNVLLILGLTAIIFPIAIQAQIVQREVPILIAVSLVFLILIFDGNLSLLDGLLLLGGMLGFLTWQFYINPREKSSAEESLEGAETEIPNRSKNTILHLILLVAGVAGLWVGARWMVSGASELAESLGVSKLVIGLTIVAIGSSAPEIVTSLVAARRGFPEMAVGNVIGSNIANLLLVGGITATVSKEITIPSESFQFDIPVMLGTSIACLPIFTTSHKIDRWEGFLFLFCYVGFNVVLFIKPMLNDSFPNWSQLVWVFLVPLIAATIYVLFSKENSPPQQSQP